MEYVAREMRALGLTVMVASSRDFGRLLPNTWAESDVRMGLQDHIRTWALMLTLEGGPVSALLFDGGTGRCSEQERSHTYARATLGATAFPRWGLPAVDVWRAAVWALSDGGSYTSKAGSASVLHARSRQMSHVTARPGDGGAEHDPAKKVVRDVLELWIDIWLHLTAAQRKREYRTVLGTWRNPALFRLPGGSAGTKSKAL